MIISTGLGLFVYQRSSHQCFFLGEYLHLFDLKNMIFTLTKDYFGERNGPILPNFEIKNNNSTTGYSPQKKIV